MNRPCLWILSALVLATATATGAVTAGSLPDCGEQPFGAQPDVEDSVAPSTLARAEVVAAARATPPLAGEASAAATPALAGATTLVPADAAPRERASVVAELREAPEAARREEIP